jgi:hypothetical protein
MTFFPPVTDESGGEANTKQDLDEEVVVIEDCRC